MSIIDDGPSSNLHNSYSHLSTQEKCTRLIDESDGGKIYPLTFPKPQASPTMISSLAAQLRTSGEGVSDTGNDITTAWGGLTNYYESPGHDHELYAVLNPVARDGDTVQSGLNRMAGALEDFAETLESIQGRWDTLISEAYEFRRRIADEGDGWDDGVGFLWLQENDNVTENQRLYDRGVALIEDYEQAERDCANRINAGLVDRTRFEATPTDTEDLDDDVFYHGYEGDLSELATEWDIGPSGTDLPWWGDAGAAVWDFGVGAVEGTGAMLGMHSSEGWFNASWGDALYEYHEDNIQSALGLVGLYDAESDSYGLAGWDSVGSAWKELAHSVVPWEEWGDRPGYVIGTALLNIGATVGGAVLTATGVGATVGVPLMAWRGMAILDGMGPGRGGSGGDGVDLPNGQHFGGPDAPVVQIDANTFDTGDFSPGQLADMQRSLNQLQDPRSGGGGGGSGSRPTRPTTPVAHDPSTGRSPQGDADRSGFTGDRDNRNDPTSEQLRESDRSLNGTGGTSGRSPESWEGGPGDGHRRSETDKPLATDRAGDRDSRSGPETQGNQGDGPNQRRDESPGDRSPDLGENSPIARDGTNTTPSQEGSDPADRGTSRDDKSDGDSHGSHSGDREFVHRAGGSEGVNDQANLDSGDGFFDQNGDKVDIGHRDETGTYFDDEGRRYVDAPESADALRRYDEIRSSESDTVRISENTGFDVDILNQVKEHLFFREHTGVAVPPEGAQRHGRFAPMDHIGQFWQLAESGRINEPKFAAESAHFRRLMMHEYVESRLMEEGVPYRSQSPDVWDEEGLYTGTSEHHGAHDIAPLEGNRNVFALWPKWGLPKPDFDIADDLSNLDNVVDIIFETKGYK